MKVHTLTVPDDLGGERADRIVAALLDLARSESRAAFDSGGVEMEGGAIKPSQRLVAGSSVVVTLPAPARGVTPDDSVPFSVLHEDASLLVVDKPIGVVVHPTSDRSTGTLVHGLLARFPEIEGVGAADRWGIVHRLDRDTSGLLVVARTPEAYGRLSDMIREHAISRRYLALVRGSFDATRGTIDAPIGRDRRNATRMSLDRTGRPATTHYRRLAEWDEPAVSLVDVTLETGRTHQIRVHMAAIDHPIVGDPAYGSVGGPGDPGRPWLHARRLGFDHPVTGERLDVVAPLPEDLADSLATIGDPVRGSSTEAEETP